MMEFNWPPIGEIRRGYLIPPFFIDGWDWMDGMKNLVGYKMRLKWGIACLDPKFFANGVIDRRGEK